MRFKTGGVKKQQIFDAEIVCESPTKGLTQASLSDEVTALSLQLLQFRSNGRGAIIYCIQIVHSGHCRVDERSLAMHRLIAARVLADPALLNKARQNLRRWQASHGSPKLALVEWEQILDDPVNQVTQFLAERSERAARLRQSSAFAGSLKETERRAIYEKNSTRTHYPRGGSNLG